MRPPSGGPCAFSRGCRTRPRAGAWTVGGFGSFRGDADGRFGACFGCEPIARRPPPWLAAPRADRRRRSRCGGFGHAATRNGPDLNGPDTNGPGSRAYFQRRPAAALAAGQPEQSAALPPSRRYDDAGQSSTADQHIHTAITRRCDSGLRQSDRFWCRQYGLRFRPTRRGAGGVRRRLRRPANSRRRAKRHLRRCRHSRLPRRQSLRPQEGRCRPSFTRPGPPRGWAPRCRRGRSRCR